MRSFGILGLIVFTASFAGCSSSDNPPTPTGTTSGTAQLADGGCADKTLVPYGTQCIAKADATSKCIAETTSRFPGTKTSDTTCGAGCTCTYCAPEMQQCGTDFSCSAIVKCANDNNCINTACYIQGTMNGPCKELIDHADNDAGITSNGVGLAQLVNACATKTKIGHYDYSNREGPVCNASCM